MKRPATWKILTVGLAATGLGLVGAGTAFADTGPLLSSPFGSPRPTHPSFRSIPHGGTTT